jgi:hypothetical protein
MNWYKNKSIGVKLMLTYSIIVIIILFIGYQSISKVSSMGQIVNGSFYNQSLATAGTTKTTILIFTVIGMFLGITVGYFISEFAIKRPVHNLMNKFSRAFDFSTNGSAARLKNEIIILTGCIDTITANQRKIANSLLNQRKIINDSSAEELQKLANDLEKNVQGNFNKILNTSV